MKTIEYDRLVKQIYKLKEDKRFKNNIDAIAALEEIMFWAEEEIIPTISEEV